VKARGSNGNRVSATENRALWCLRLPRGPNQTFGAERPHRWADQAIGQVGSDALSKVGKTHPHRTGRPASSPSMSAGVTTSTSSGSASAIALHPVLRLVEPRCARGWWQAGEPALRGIVRERGWRRRRRPVWHAASYGDGGSRLDGDSRWSGARSLGLGQQCRHETYRRVERRAGRERGPQLEELVAVADRPCMGGGGELPHTAVSVGSSQPSLRMRSRHPGLGSDTGARCQGASSARVTTWGASSSNSVSIGPSEGGIVRVIFTHEVSGTDTDASSMTRTLLTHLRMSTDWYMYQTQILKYLW